jgi:hypothetical protein
MTVLISSYLINPVPQVKVIRFKEVRERFKPEHPANVSKTVLVYPDSKSGNLSNGVVDAP